MNIYDLSFGELKSMLEANNIASFRASQIWDWLYVKMIDDFEDMTNLDKKTKAFLADNFTIQQIKTIKEFSDNDGTIKALLQLDDGEIIETVLMKFDYGNSVCVTTQIGCKIGCSFCASHLNGFKRNLTSGEIVQQVLYFAKQLQQHDQRVSRVVIMGIGEPLDNIDNVLKFIDIINDHKGLNIGARHITISTSGIVPGINVITNYNKQINLAISLHAPNNALRSKIMKINNAYPIEQIMEAIDNYIDITNRRVSLEYIMLAGINDSKKEAQELINLVRGKNVHINLIPFNAVNEYQYQTSYKQTIEDFAQILHKANIQVTIRHSKGQNIDGACGQLRNSYYD